MGKDKNKDLSMKKFITYNKHLFGCKNKCIAFNQVVRLKLLSDFLLLSNLLKVISNRYILLQKDVLCKYLTFQYFSKSLYYFNISPNYFLLLLQLYLLQTDSELNQYQIKKHNLRRRLYAS